MWAASPSTTPMRSPADQATGLLNLSQTIVVRVTLGATNVLLEQLGQDGITCFRERRRRNERDWPLIEVEDRMQHPCLGLRPHLGGLLRLGRVWGYGFHDSLARRSELEGIICKMLGGELLCARHDLQRINLIRPRVGSTGLRVQDCPSGDAGQDQSGGTGCEQFGLGHPILPVGSDLLSECELTHKEG